MNFERTYTELDLSENFLTELPDGGLRGIHVTKLNIVRNAIRTIHPRAFYGVQYVSQLDLSHNSLTRLAPGSFKGLNDLTVLRLSYNGLTASGLPRGTFADVVPLLSELDLSGNDLVSVPSEALSQLTSLKTLILRGAKLKQIDAYAFDGLRSLVHLDLGENTKPLAVPPEGFCGLQPTLRSEPGVRDWQGMKTLLLDHNGLSTVHPCLAKIVWTLSAVDVSGNPLCCDCMLFLLRDMSRGAQFPGAQCATPSALGGSYLQEIPPESYDCSHNRTYLSCESTCRERPPSSAQRESAAAALSGECVIFPHPLVVWGVFLALYLALPLSTTH